MPASSPSSSLIDTSARRSADWKTWLTNAQTHPPTAEELLTHATTLIHPAVRLWIQYGQELQAAQASRSDEKNQILGGKGLRLLAQTVGIDPPTDLQRWYSSLSPTAQKVAVAIGTAAVAGFVAGFGTDELERAGIDTSPNIELIRKRLSIEVGGTADPGLQEPTVRLGITASGYRHGWRVESKLTAQGHGKNLEELKSESLAARFTLSRLGVSLQQQGALQFADPGDGSTTASEFISTSRVGLGKLSTAVATTWDLAPEGGDLPWSEVSTSLAWREKGTLASLSLNVLSDNPKVVSGASLERQEGLVTYGIRMSVGSEQDTRIQASAVGRF